MSCCHLIWDMSLNISSSCFLSLRCPLNFSRPWARCHLLPENTNNQAVSHYRALRIYRVAFLFLVGLVIFYTVSFNLSLNHDQIYQAYTANISALALAAQNMDGTLIKILNLILNIFAVVTAYFAMFLCFRDACVGIAINVLKRFVLEEKLIATISISVSACSVSSFAGESSYVTFPS